jgi:hypothetical protein
MQEQEPEGAAMRIETAKNKQQERQQSAASTTAVRGEEICGEGEGPSETTTTTPRFRAYKEIRV